ncbi:S1 family peptidase [Pseudonocardiaceae bacterium YIM PH 21723]|nr:S1 family peptidase [Pseudonocardiaceae bacterium YIM PH 21723]
MEYSNCGWHRTGIVFYSCEVTFPLHVTLECAMNRYVVPAAAFALLAAASVLSAHTVDSTSVAYTGELSPALLQAYERDLGLNEQQAREAIGYENSAATVEQNLQKLLGDRLAGSHYDPAIHRLVASVTDERSAQVARRLGAEPRFVAHSGRALADGMAKLNATAAGSEIAGWAIDPKNNVITVSGVTATAIDAFVAEAGVPQDAVRAEVSPARLVPHATITGGIAFNINGSSRCSIGFSARTSAGDGFVTAGHCGTSGARVTIGGQAAGSFSQSTFPGNDWAFVAVGSGHTLTNQVQGHSQPVTGSTESAVGASICRSGSTTGYRCGTVSAKNQTANYPQGAVRGLTRSTACSEPGDSGGSFVSGGNAQGTLSGGPSNASCSSPSGAYSLFQPVLPALSALGATLVLS